MDFCAYRNLELTWRQVAIFLDDLSRRGRVAEWQPEQARDAVSIYLQELLCQGVNIRVVQDLLGHESVETTMIYTHVLRQSSLEVTSPLNTLPEVG